jgi:hypothetical protein
MDWLNLELRLQAYEHRLISDIAKMDTTRQITTMALPGLGQSAEYMQNFALEAVSAFRGTLLPWHATAARHTVRDALDEVVDWYLTFRPDLLEAANHG